MTSWLGLVGVLVGGVITAGGQWLTTSLQQRQVRAERAMRLADSRRAAYADYVKYYLRIRDQMREIFEVDRDHVRARELRPAYEETWRLCVEARASVYVAGPEKVVTACEKLHRAVGALSEIYDDWLNRLAVEADGGPKARWPSQQHDAAIDKTVASWNVLLGEIHAATGGAPERT